MNEQELLRLLMVNALEAWRATLIGIRPPVTEALYQVLTHPQPGDLVLEVTTRRNDPSRFGRLLRVVQEPISGEWNEETDGPRPSETYWYIQDIYGNEHRWYNCQFIRVLEHPTDALDEAKARGLYTYSMEVEEQ